MIDPDRGVLVLLDDVTTALVATGYADPDTTAPALRLRCLIAGGRLEDIGARPSRAAAQDATGLTGRVVLAVVVTMLLEPDPTFDPRVLSDAREALQAVLAELG